MDARLSKALIRILVSGYLITACNCIAAGAAPEGTVGWWYYIHGARSGYASDPVEACKLTAQNHMGTPLVAMRPFAYEASNGKKTTLQECKYSHSLRYWGEHWYGSTRLVCEAGYEPIWPGFCKKNPEKPRPLTCNGTDPGATIGNPVVLSSGMKLKQALDIVGTPSNTLQVRRMYRQGRSSSIAQSAGMGWSFSFDRDFVTNVDLKGRIYRVSITDGDGSHFEFLLQADGTYASVNNDDARVEVLDSQRSEWAVQIGKNQVERFSKLNNVIKLVSVHQLNGTSEYFSYDDVGRLKGIADSNGRSLRVTWEGDVVETIGNEEVSVQYSYLTAIEAGGAPIEGTELLQNVRIYDGAGDLLSSTRYHYDDANFRFLLTGITDGNGVRQAKYGYNGNAEVLVTEHADGANRYSISYPSPSTRVVTSPLGAQSSIQLVSPNNGSGARVSSASQQAGSGSMPSKKSFAYDAKGNLIHSIDFNGNKTCVHKDEQRGLELMRVEGLSANAVCLINAVANDEARVSTTQWHPDFALKTRIAGPNQIISFIFNGQPDSDGNVTICAKDARLPNQKPLPVLCSKSIQATSDRTGAMGFQAIYMDKPRVWKFEYNDEGKLLTAVGPQDDDGNSAVTRFHYRVSNGEGNVRGDLSQVVDAAGLTTSYEDYDGMGRPIRIILANGLTETLRYRGDQLTESILTADGGRVEATEFSYDKAGLLVKMMLPDRSVRTFVYDGAHRLIGVSNSDGSSMQLVLDATGNVKERRFLDESGRLIQVTNQEYDALGRLLKKADGQTGAQSYRYDANGNLQSVTDVLQHVQTWRYDRFDRPVSMETSTPTIAKYAIGYAYNHHGQLTSVTDPRGLTTSYTFSPFKELVELKSPDTGTTSFQFGADGKLSQKRDNSARITKYRYDAAGRPVQIGRALLGYGVAGGGAGKLTRIEDNSGYSTLSYDPFSRLRSVLQTVQVGQQSNSFRVSYEYGEFGSGNGHLTKLTYPSSSRVEFSYDVEGRVAGMTVHVNGEVAPIALLSDIKYRPLGEVSGWTWGESGQQYFRSFDATGRIASYPLGETAVGGSTRTLTYDALGRVKSYVHSGDLKSTRLNQQFEYDQMGRLVSFNSSSTSQAFTYDLNGNRVTTRFGRSYYLNTTAPASNRLLRTTGPGAVQWNTYDLSGNLVGDGLFNNVYNADGRLAVTRAGKTTVYHLHNGLGQRVAKVSVPGDYSTSFGGVPLGHANNTYYVYDGAGHLLGEYDGRGGPLQETVYLGDTPVAVLRKSKRQGEQERTEVFHIYADHLNTPRVITRAADNRIIWRWDSSDPFGLLPPDENPSASGQFTYNPRFPGQVYDVETNLHYNYYRDYDPRIGRYLQSDPIGLSGGINTYAYALNNPLSFADPLGLDVNVCFYSDAAMGFGHVGYGLPGEFGTQGFYPTGNPFNSLGDIKPDTQKEQQCKVIESSPEQDQCMLRCRVRRDAIPGHYGLTTRQCTSFVRDCLKECGLPVGNYSGPRPSPFFLSLPGKQ